ncbi:sensor histidine kinase [Pedobacter frigoris]|uniref:sensor histidine kinase n=1 Tax=Pedobacter frigoris TaxID=2571272 RepID=UPI0029308233|nr:PAS domain-containing protein [Pedobacter frigoris]
MSVRRLKNAMEDLQNKNKSLILRDEHFALIELISHLGSWEIFIGQKTVSWSDELYRIYGIEDLTVVPDEALNERIIAPEYRQKVIKELNFAVSNKTTFAVEYQIIQPSGMRKYVLGQGRYIEKENKLIGTVQDITELKQAVLKLKINESLLREAEMVSHSGSWEWLENKEFLLWSDEMYNIHGFLPHSVFVNDIFYQTLIHEDDLSRVLAEFKQARATKSAFKLNYRIVRPSGEIRHVLSAAEYKRIGLNENYAYVGNTQDVTELREAQVLLEEKMLALNRSNEDLEQFAYVASHDLQEPLRKIQAFGERLKNEFSKELGMDAIDYIDRMRKAAERMRALIEDLLSFSKATRDKRNFVKIELRAVVEKTLKELDFIIESKDAKIDLLLEEEVFGIESQLIQLFQNLIANSLKFTAPGISPKIKITGAYLPGSEINWVECNQNQTYCVVEVTDNGIGFDDEDAGEIFDIFHRLHSRSAYEGTGIGLAICKKIADNHSGFIFAKGMRNEGATFKVILPVKQTN